MVLYDMSPQCIAFPKGFVATLVACALIFFSASVCSFVSSESCASSKALSTAFNGTNMVSYGGVGTLDVVFQMRVAQEVFRTVGVRTFEGSGIGMRTEVFNQTGLTVEGLRAAIVRTMEGFWV